MYPTSTRPDRFVRLPTPDRALAAAPAAYSVDHPSPSAKLEQCVAGYDPRHQLDLLLVNSPLRDYAQRPRVNDYTLPVLGMGYIATYAASHGYRVGVLDAEAHGLSVEQTVAAINAAAPRWAGFALLAPTYEISASIAARLNPDIHLLLGGHQAKAMPTEILSDPRMARCAALVLGEGETRVVELLADVRRRADLPGVMWLEPLLGTPTTGGPPGLGHQGRSAAYYLAPDVDAMPLLDRRYLAQDPRPIGDSLQASMVGARGCPYNCSFCGAAVSANPDITIRTRAPENILAEMDELRGTGVTAFRFVDDLFLGARRVIDQMMTAFSAERVGDWARWDATGRINVLHRASNHTLDVLADNGLRQVALGIESGSVRMLDQIDKRITPEMAVTVVRRLTERGINVKGYFILGFHTETTAEVDATVRLVEDLWERTDRLPGHFTASVFEFRPYPGTPDWHRILATGRFTTQQLLAYTAVDLTGAGQDPRMFQRDEFNFSTNLPLAEAPIPHIRAAIARLSRIQYQRNAAVS